MDGSAATPAANSEPRGSGSKSELNVSELGRRVQLQQCLVLHPWIQPALLSKFEPLHVAVRTGRASSTDASLHSMRQPGTWAGNNHTPANTVPNWKAEVALSCQCLAREASCMSKPSSTGTGLRRASSRACASYSESRRAHFPPNSAALLSSGSRCGCSFAFTTSRVFHCQRGSRPVVALCGSHSLQ